MSLDAAVDANALSAPPGAGEVSLSDAAAARVAQLIAMDGRPGLFLRLSVSGGGCAGFQYGFDLDDERAEDDAVSRNGEVELRVDPVSAGFLGGAVIDYVEDMLAAAFQVRNPNAASSCGCGSSFSI